MKHPTYEYVEVAYGGVNNRNNVIKISEIEIPQKPDCYRTVYRYEKDLLEYADKNKSVKGYTGNVYADYLPIDIDNQTDLEQAQADAKTVLNTLLINFEVDLEMLRIYFSGAKGFHIFIPASLFGYKPMYELPQAFKAVVPKLVGGVKTDLSIYDRVRLLRFNNTINSKTGLYKIQITPAELLHKTTPEIMEMAKTSRNGVSAEPAEEPNVYLQQEFKAAMESLVVKRERKQAGVLALPKNAKVCYYEIMKGVGEGDRDNAGLRLAVHLLKEYPIDFVSPMMDAWNDRNIPPMDSTAIDKLVAQAANNDYDFGCNDFILKEYCNPNRCVHGEKRGQEKITAEKIYTYDEARSKYTDYIASLSERQIQLGFKKIDNAMRGIAPGEVCEVMARTGVGKTAFALNVIRHVSVSQNVPILFFSLEQPLAQIYERTMQITNEAEGREIENIYKQNKDVDRYHQVANKNYKNLFVVEEDFLTYEDLRDYIVLSETKIGKRPSLVCVDYLGRMKGRGGSTYEITSELAKQLKALAKELDVAVLYLHQTSRMGKTGAEEISLDMARDSGVVEEAADFIIGMWRPEINNEEAQKSDEEEIKIALLKNRKGRLGKASYKFIKPYLTMRDYSEGENDPEHIFEGSTVWAGGKQ